MNPYHFVPLGPPGKQMNVKTHESFQGESGTLACRLTARTHLFIAKSEGQTRSQNQHQRLQLMRAVNRKPLLPGSSLKGVIRSVAEALSGSCLTLPGESTSYYDRDKRRNYYYEMPEGFERCRPKELCPACRIFGGMKAGDPFLGKINISDAVAEGEAIVEDLTLGSLMQPKPRHRAWYEHLEQRGFMRGRKFYYHHPRSARTTTRRDRFNKTVEAVKPGSAFGFSVDYTNLTDDELALLIFALVLEPEMCHKIGMGKPVGLGSAKIEMIQWRQHNLRMRYERLGEGTKVLEADALTAEIDRWTDRYHEQYAKWADCLNDLRRIWRWDPSATDDVKYPSRGWFNDNPTEPIENAP